MSQSTLSMLALTAYGAPLLLFAATIWAKQDPLVNPRRLFRFARFGAIVAFVYSLLAATAVFLSGPIVTPLLGLNEFGLSIRLDALSVVMMWLVAFIGILVIQYSGNYLDGDARQATFLGGLTSTIGAVLLLVLSGNLVQLVLAWVGTSLALHQLLIFYRERRRAIIAARKKFIAARLGDICLIIAAVLIGSAFGTGDLGGLNEAASQAFAAGTLPAGIGIATLLLGTAAALKSAMFPFHGWLLEVMETPTPVSALLHAGLINAGTFLVVRFGELMFLNANALHLLIFVGGFTALFASVAMITQSSVKVSLAYSSAAHMGFMLMLCGFGAHSVAIMHLVAHSFYKAHAFLSSGSVVEYTQATGSQTIKHAPRPFLLIASLLTSLGIFVAVATAVGIDLTQRPGEAALGAIFVMAVGHLLAKGVSDTPRLYVILRTALAAVGVTLAFFALELMAAWILSDSVAYFPTPTAGTVAVMVIAVVAFALITLLHTLLPAWASTPVGRAAYVHLKNGFYVNTMLDRLIGSYQTQKGI